MIANKILDRLTPPNNGHTYANVITAFAIILAVEYSSTHYDVWDIFIGLMSVVLGCAFMNDEENIKDEWFSFFSASLISLGVIIIISSIIFMFPLLEGPSPKRNIYCFQLYELIRLVAFLGLAFVTKRHYAKRPHENIT